MERFRNLSAMTPGLWLSGITRLKVIDYSADAFTQSLDAHMISKYGGNSKTKNHDQTPIAVMYGGFTFFKCIILSVYSVVISRKEINLICVES